MPADTTRHKILIVVGTRPEVIKMAPLYKELKNQSNFNVLLCATGQHSALLELALNDFDLSADYNLELMQHGQGLSNLTSRALIGIEEVLREVNPDAVLVHGDTTTTFTAALAAFYAQIPIGHVEAGLRTRDIYSPFPEEFNRQAVSRIANWNFAPTIQAKQNLMFEGVEEDRIIVTGNTVVDSIRLLVEESNNGKLEKSWLELIDLLGFDPKLQKTVLVTTHRRENFGEGIANIFQAVAVLAKSNNQARFVLPLHPNPHIRAAASPLQESQNVSVIDPLAYRHFILLLSVSHFVITDSGGIQEEAVTLNNKVILARQNTERPEGIDNESIVLAGTSTEQIVRHGNALLAAPNSSRGLQGLNTAFGDGRASARIVNELFSDFAEGQPSRYRRL